jgi:DNA repair exonuclease SbcCD ATPase subunit
MRAKCFHNDFGYCKFSENCRFDHPAQVCRERSCQNKTCPKRHPKPCRSYFLMKQCRFGNECKYEHTFDCEVCENLKYLINKESENIEEKMKKKDEAIAKMADEILNLKKDNKYLEKELKTSKGVNDRLLVENRKWNDEKTQLKESITEYKKENGHLKSALKVTKKDLQEAKDSLDKMHEIQNTINKENKVLKVNLENMSKAEKAAIKKSDDQIELKNQEIKSLTLTRKIGVESTVKLKQINEQLEKEIGELKLKENVPNKESFPKLPYPCDKCESTFKSAGLLIKHVKSEHQNTPASRP